VPALFARASKDGRSTGRGPPLEARRKSGEHLRMTNRAWPSPWGAVAKRRPRRATANWWSGKWN